jgi:hypothetical protein
MGWGDRYGKQGSRYNKWKSDGNKPRPPGEERLGLTKKAKPKKK